MTAIPISAIRAVLCWIIYLQTLLSHVAAYVSHPSPKPPPQPKKVPLQPLQCIDPDCFEPHKMYERIPSIPGLPRLNPFVISRAMTPHGYGGDKTRLKAALKRAREEKGLHVVVLGGSVPWGARLRDNRKKWSDRLQIMLTAVLKPIKVTVTNLAVPGTPSHTQAQAHFTEFLPHLQHAHIVIVDISMNERPDTNYVNATGDGYDSRAHEGRRLMELLLTYTSNSTGIIYFETFSTANIIKPIVHQPQQMYQCSADSTVGFVNMVAVPRPGKTRQSDLLFLSDCINYDIDVATNFHWCSLLDLHIPIISYPDVICYYSSGPQKVSDPNSLWGRDPHPNPEVHQFISDIIGMSLLEVYHDVVHSKDVLVDVTADSTNEGVSRTVAWTEYMRLQPANLSRVFNEDKPDVDCSVHPTTVLSSRLNKLFVPVSRGEDWGYGEDRSGKSGWIVNPSKRNSVGASSTSATPQKREIAFSLFSRANNGIGRIIKLEILKSYTEDMGTLSCCLDCDGGEHFVPSKVFDTRWQKHESQNEVVRMPFEAAVSSVKNGTSVNVLRCRANEGKVKIISVIGC
jgi:hypothetical protein